ncbi:MAG: hypothetical protein ACU0BB_16465 [Paracoccaceae bacterium]|jgi:hypothetical protein
MPLEILLILVVGGIFAVAILLHLTGRSKKFALTAETARIAWLRHAPGTKIQEIQLASSGTAALVRTAKRIGLVWSFGDDTVARFVRNPDLRDTNTGLRVGFGDFGAPSVHLHLTDDERREWRKTLGT